MIRVLAPTELAECHSDYENLKSAFKLYKAGGALPFQIGKDVPYSRPPSALAAKLHHIHLPDTDSIWTSTTPQTARTSDTHLVYCEHLWVPDCYLIAAILEPNAHELARQNQRMISLAQMAERFHERDC